MQEAYCLPCSICLLCLWEGLPHPGHGGVSHPVMVGGFPIQSWWGVPWVPPSRPGWGVSPTIQTWLGYPPHPDLAWGYPIQSWWVGVPHHHSDLAGPPLPQIKVWTDTQSENVTSPHSLDVGGKKVKILLLVLWWNGLLTILKHLVYLIPLLLYFDFYYSIFSDDYLSTETDEELFW